MYGNHHRKTGKNVLWLILILGVVITIVGLIQSAHPAKITKFRSGMHYLSSNPSHGAVIHSAPDAVRIQFNQALTNLSSISVTRGKAEDSIGPMILSLEGKTMNRKVNPTIPDGIYTVNYTACFTDNQCDYGYFQFQLQRD